MPASTDRAFHFLQGIRPLVVRLVIFPEKVSLFPDEDRQIVDIDLFLFFVLVVQIKLESSRSSAIVLSPIDLPVFVLGIQIKDKDSARIEIVVDQAEHLRQILRLQNIIHTVTDGDNRRHRAVKLKFSYPGRDRGYRFRIFLLSRASSSISSELSTPIIS